MGANNNAAAGSSPGDDRLRMIAGLLKPTAYRHPIENLHMVQTHGAWVLLTGTFAYKIKKPVNFGFLDYSTLAKRRFNCEEELRLNRRFAPGIYLDVVSINGTVDKPRIEGEGPVIEYAVKMRQFPEQGLLSRVADAGLLDQQLVDQITQQVVDFHQSAAVAGQETRFGEADQITHWIVENFAHIRVAIDAPEELERLTSMQGWVERERTRLEGALIDRKRHGYIRECHGDLHLGNMTLVDGRVTLFDCIEFNPELRWIDVMSDVAFVLMDLEERGFGGFANRFINGYLQQTGDYAGLQPLRWYKVYRALVRAKVAVLRSQQQEGASDVVAQLQADYRRHIQLAESYMRAPAPAMLLMYGLSGSGKTTVAAWLCEVMGMIQLRSDVERKRLAGLAPLDRSYAQVGGGIYTQTGTERTYQRLLELAAAVLGAGYAVVVDATFLKQRFRDRFRELAHRNRVPSLILSCETPDAELARRLETRARQGTDASEATLDVLMAQRRDGEPLAAAELADAIRLDTRDLAYRDVLPGLIRTHLHI